MFTYVLQHGDALLCASRHYLTIPHRTMKSMKEGGALAQDEKEKLIPKKEASPKYL